MSDDLRPDVFFTDSFTVEIHLDQPEAPLRVRRDDGTAADFMTWRLDESVYPLRGSMASGPGFFYGVFSIEDKPAIVAWFKERGFDV